ncbi:hypothetical protein GKS11_01360 [Streptococcus uberis]|uniref:hypothetical protein n=1 Tax=Streptococcus uberis TaxID=1349 RepID=UPI0012B5FE3D|nr:hypothetical protein [Streptococcus uberis]MTC88018.1 hypothetical protein [Streptococcus uberis]
MNYNITIKQSHLRAFIIAYTIIFIIIGFSIGCLYSDSKYQQRNDALHQQLRRTQYQLKKAREQNVEQTNKIAELTGNGG